MTADNERRAEVETYEWSLTMALPDATPDDPYDPDEFAEALREVADRIAGEEMPSTGELWDRRGRLLGYARLSPVRDARGDDKPALNQTCCSGCTEPVRDEEPLRFRSGVLWHEACLAARSPQDEDHDERDALAREIAERRTHMPAYLVDDETWAAAVAEADARLLAFIDRREAQNAPLFDGRGCGHPPDPVAARRDGRWVCHCGKLLHEHDAHPVPEAPGPVVLCQSCGCHVALLG